MNMLLDRLTEAIQNGIVKYKIRKGACAVGCVEKLGLYEDIGLLPEQVKQLKKEKEEIEQFKAENAELKELLKLFVADNEIGNLCEKCVADCVDSMSEEAEPTFQCGCFKWQYQGRYDKLMKENNNAKI